jgi:hypothetical protein
MSRRFPVLVGAQDSPNSPAYLYFREMFPDARHPQLLVHLTLTALAESVLL